MRLRELTVITLLAVILIIGLSAQPTEFNANYSMEANAPELVEDTVGSYISVGYNWEFPYAGFTGAGTEENPYVLDGVTVTTASGGWGIHISDTTAHFRIQNSVVDLSSTSSTYGINLYNVDNATLYNCTVIGTPTAVSVDYSADINITLSNIHDCSSDGIQVQRTTHVDLINNTIRDITGYRGMRVFQTPNATISGNIINRINYDGSLSSSWGIDCQQTDNLTIINNEVLSTIKGTGISFDTGSNIVMDSNVIWQASTCVRPYATPGIVISNNNISCGFNINLLMSNVVDAHVFGNSIHHTTNANGRGIHIMGSSNGLYENNDISKSWYGIRIDPGSGNNTIKQNSIGWLDGVEYYGWDDRISTPKNNWTSNQFSNYAGEDYAILGAAGVNDSSASLLTDSIAPTIDSPVDITINDTDTDKWVTWHPDDRFPDSYMRYINYSDPQLFTWCNSSISISLDSLAPGVYDISIVAYDCSGYSSTQDNVRVTVLDTQDPVFTSATGDYTVEYGERVWTNFTATDDTPYLLRAWADDSELLLSPWNDIWTSPLLINWDHAFPGKGLHNYTIMLSDKAGNFAIHTSMVTVEDTTAPTCPDFPADFSAETGDTAWVNFTIYDPYNHNFEIWLDDVQEGPYGYISGEYQTYPLSYATPGEHNVTLVTWDQDFNTLTLTCIVTFVDSTGPEITGPDDFTFEAGESPTISWSWTELDPGNYSIYENGTEITFSTTFSGDIQHVLDGLDVGIWNITLIIYDESGHWTVDELWVTVEDTTAPTLSGSSTRTVELGDVLQINWQVNDIDSWDQDGTWSVIVNDTEEQTGVWDSTQVSFSFEDVVGLYNVTVVVTDASGNSVTYTTWVTCEDTVAPLISGNEDQEIEDGSSILLNWTCSDLDPEALLLLRNGSVIVDLEWAGNDYSTLVSGLSAGVYNYTLIVIDASGNSANDTVFVTVIAVSTTTTDTTTTTTTSTSTSTTTSTTASDTTSTDTTSPPPDGGDVMMLVVIIGGIGAILVVVVLLFIKRKK